MSYFIKSPGSTLDFTFDWGFSMLEPGEEIAADLGWSVEPAGGVAVASSSGTATTTTALLSGGRAGEAFLVRSRIETTAGRIVERALTVRIGNI